MCLRLIFLSMFFCSLAFAQGEGYNQGYGQGYRQGQPYGGNQNYNGQYPQNNTIPDIPGLTPGSVGPSETGADRQIAEIDKEIAQLNKKAAQLQDQGQKAETQANQIFFYDSLRARTLIHEAESYQAQAGEIQQQIAQLQRKKEDLQRYAH